MIRIITSLSFAVIALTASALHASAAEPLKLDFSNDTVGADASAFVNVVGVWRVEAEGDNKVFAVDGRQWKEGQAATGIADKARTLYGERYAECLDNVKAYAYFPFAVAKGIEDFRGGEISLRFEGIEGRIDQAAGIVFNLKPNGDYLILRANEPDPARPVSGHKADPAQGAVVAAQGTTAGASACGVVAWARKPE